MKDMFYCKFIHTDKCIDKENMDCNNCKLKDCNSCENSWSSNVCNQCRFKSSDKVAEFKLTDKIGVGRIQMPYGLYCECGKKVKGLLERCECKND